MTLQALLCFLQVPDIVVVLLCFHHTAESTVGSSVFVNEKVCVYRTVSADLMV